MSKKNAFAFFLLIFSFSWLFSQNASVVNVNLKQGADAYMAGDWTSAIFFLRKVVSTPGNFTDENVFMLIKSEIYAGEYRQAESDCERFLSQFPASPYSGYVSYQKGRLLHLLAKNEDAVLCLSDFCHENPESDLFPLALFWIAESFYDEYNFESARGLYERLVNDYPACEKSPQAQYKLDLIERRSREEKLLYLLKVIGEENLSTREEYERQLRVYSLEDENGVRKALLEAQARIAELEAGFEQNGFGPAHFDEELKNIEVAKEPVTPEAAAERTESVAATPAPAESSSTASGISRPKAPVT
ncbi:MAG: tetratricopeptide repeat protein, partial [Treponema sp.]|nr:tetratricopeptide repeat protein [Treponema sp.]